MLRAELLGHIVAAQFDLEAVLSATAITGGASDAAKQQLEFLHRLQRSVSAANPIALGQLRSEIAATVSAAQAVAQQGRDLNHSTASAAELADAAKATRALVDATMRDLRDYDPYLKFNSPDDERIYRQREADRVARIEAEQAKGTAQGDLNAANAAIEQMQDAAKHGADRHPDFGDRMGALTTARDQLRDALDRAPEATPDQAQPVTERASASATDAAADDLSSVMAALREAGVGPLQDVNTVTSDATRSRPQTSGVTSGRG